MATPPKGDPRRPLHLAIRSTRLLGILFLLLGSCAGLAVFLPPARLGRGSPVLYVVVLGCYVIPGAANIVFAIFLKERKFWAVVAALIVVSLQFVFALLAGVGIGSSFFITPSAIPITTLTIMETLVGFVILALAQLIYHLALSFKAIQYVPLEEQRGFEPLMIQPVPPLMPNPPSDLPPV